MMMKERNFLSKIFHVLSFESQKGKCGFHSSQKNHSDELN